MTHKPLRPRTVALLLFLTCWLVYAAHFRTNVVREHYVTFALGERLSYDLRPYGPLTDIPPDVKNDPDAPWWQPGPAYTLHPDLFQLARSRHADQLPPERLAMVVSGNNPGVGLLAAIPYALARPLIDAVDTAVWRARDAAGQTDPPAYDSRWSLAQRFYAESYARRLDIRLGLGALVTHLLCMAPATAAFVAFLYLTLRRITAREWLPLALALLYAFGTPAFFRTGFLNHNLILGHLFFVGCCLFLRPGHTRSTGPLWRSAAFGLTAGIAVLFDYSGLVLLACGGLLVGLTRWHARAWHAKGLLDGIVHGLTFTAGALPAIALLWHYQLTVFGDALLPGQHWMPAGQTLSDTGQYQGMGPPSPRFFAMLGFDHRFGLLLACPLFALMLAAPFLARSLRPAPSALPPLADASPAARPSPTLTLFSLATVLAMWLFFSMSNYVQLQFNTGIRYLASIFPFAFLPAAAVLASLPAMLARWLALGSVAFAWCQAMYPEVESPLGLAEPVARTLLNGPSLPALRTLDNMAAFDSLIPDASSPLALFALLAACIVLLWWPLWPAIIAARRAELHPDTTP